MISRLFSTRKLNILKLSILNLYIIRPPKIGRFDPSNHLFSEFLIFLYLYLDINILMS
jgi:hypothetical protein